jgi:wobble nucleotide-excising tRNase
MRASLGSGEDIPTDYLKISDPEAHLEALRHELDVRRKAREDALTAKTEASSKLELYKEKLDGDASENAANAERKFNEQKELLSHWKHIEEVFRAKKNELSLNPMQDISESFARYLGIISSGKVSSEFPEQDKLDMNIYSDNRLLDYGKLSEGTKETVSLSFRLAALDHLFPDGGGVVVLDDPFTDMDAERTEQACELIKTFAKKHQVIFLTCKEEYIDMLQGNLIKM